MNDMKKNCWPKLIALCAAAVIGVLALLVLVPTSPALMVDSPVTLWSASVDDWGEPAGLRITAYSVYIAVGALLALGLTAVMAKLRGRCPAEGVALGLTSGAFALVCSHLLFCAVRWGYIINDLGGTAAFLVTLWEGGYTMYGAILGGLLGAFVFAMIRRQPVMPCFDMIVPGMLILVAAGRFAEQFTLQGMASYRAAEALSMLPFASVGEWGDPMLKVYAYEVIVAFAAFGFCMWPLCTKAPAGRAAENGLIVLSTWQIMMESWRGDELIKFGFVCLNMLMAAAVLVAILVPRIVRTVKAQGWKPWTIARIVLFLAAIGVVIAIEFALDKSDINNTLLYAVMTAAIIGMTASVLIGDGRGEA
ncbi:MAG: prolipoprotein diacylglyceryl transferase [Clostridia bacterium]|nr:prolipoprotein diacylglyceryl transferase [Clostridia bacterium]